MADHYTRAIERRERDRKKQLAIAKAARTRRRHALRKRQWAEARSARRVAQRANAQAQRDLRAIHRLRAERKQKNLAARLLRHRRSAGKAADGGQLYWFDGVRVRAEVYPNLVWARKRGRWKGRVMSGYRTPWYSTSLCYGLCGHPSCSGTCAGAGSNHVRIALDVTDYITFGQEMRVCPVGIRIFNDLPRDGVHFSPNGH